MGAKKDLKQAYKKLVVRTRGRKFGLSDLLKEAGQDTASYTEHFGSFQRLEKAIWNGFFNRIKKTLHSDDVYDEYFTRQKMLAFYYTLTEILKDDREYIRFCMNSRDLFEFTPLYMEEFRDAYLKFVKGLIAEGKVSEEIESRMILSDYYVRPHWAQFLTIIEYWASDESEELQKTDEFIEKAVNLGFDVMGRNVLDSTWEFGKFILTGKK